MDIEKFFKKVKENKKTKIFSMCCISFETYHLLFFLAHPVTFITNFATITFLFPVFTMLYYRK